MPVVPRLTGPQVESAPLPGVRRDAAETALSRGAGLFDAQAHTHEAEAGLFQNLAQVSEHEAATIATEAYQRAQQHRALELENGFSALNRDLLFRDGGALSVKGMDAMSNSERVMAEFKTRADALRGAGLDARLTQVYDQLRAKYEEKLHYDVDNHTLQEVERAEGAAMHTGIASALADAKTHALDPFVQADAFDRASTILRRFGPRQGLDADAIELQLRQIRSQMNGDVIRELLSTGNVAEARAHWDVMQEAIIGPDRDELERAVHTGTQLAAGQRLADALWDPAEKLSTLLDRLNAQTDDAEVRAHAAQELRMRAGVRDAEEQDAQRALLQRVADAADRGQRPDPNDWATLSLSQRSEWTSYALQRAKRQQPETDYAEYQRLQDEWVTSPDTFKNRNLLEARPKLDDGNYEYFSRIQATLRQGGAAAAAAARAATIDQDQFRDLASRAGLNVYDEKYRNSTDGARTLGRLMARVQEGIAAAQKTAPKGEISYEAKGAIMQQLLDQHVRLERWGADPDVSAFTVREADAPSAYVPLTEIPRTNLTEFLNTIRSIDPGMQRQTDELILARYRHRIEQAMAALRMGLGDAAIDARLRGK